MNSEETLSGEEDIDGEGVAPDMDQGEASDQEDGEEESMGLQHRSYVEPNDEVVVKIEGVGDSTDGSVLVQTKSDEASNMTVEVSPSRPKSSEVLAAFEATASDEVIRNIDVVMKLRKLTQVRVADWILRHKCCPKEYQEKIGTPEGTLALCIMWLTAFCKLVLTGYNIISSRLSQRRPSGDTGYDQIA